MNSQTAEEQVAVLRKNIVRALLVVAVPDQSQRRGLAEAENGLERGGFQGSVLSILPGGLKGRELGHGRRERRT